MQILKSILKFPIGLTIVGACVICGALSCERSQPTTHSQTPAASEQTPSPSAPISSPLRTVDMTIGSRPYTVEVADTLATQRHGLMARESMPADHGMIFVFPDESPRSFWMKNTLIPLDIIYLNATGTIVNISHMKRLDETGVPSGDAAKYAIELNLGQAAEAGVKVGDRVHIPSSCREPRR